MQLSKSYFYTLREDLKDEDAISNNLLTRAGYIKRSSAGVYMLLPLGFKTLTNIENIIRDEMNKIDSSEMLMPALIPYEIYEESGRDKLIGDSMYTLYDRFKRRFALAPTHEELFSIAAKSAVRSYKHLPFSLYQFQTKFRDETRARYGLIRVREFIMKDAYSFDINDEACDIAYQNMKQAYINIFDKLHLDYRIVQADTGIMGGELSEEFQAIAPIGEDTIVVCDSCDFSSNLEVAKANSIDFNHQKSDNKKIEVHTPNTKTIDEVSNFFKTGKDKLLKTLIYKYNDKLIAVLINGKHELNEHKLETILQAEVEAASEEDIYNIAKSSPGFIGPINLDIDVIADLSVKNMQDLIVGANKEDYHINHVNLEDFSIREYYDLRMLDHDDTCPKCQSKLNFSQAIEVGNIFKLGTSYSKAFDLNYLDENNKLNPVVMGSYGIGLGRTLAAIAEIHNDDKGLNLPIEVAPYKVGIILINSKDEEQNNYAINLYNKLNANNIDTLLDDRNERPGVKFNDLDLIGIPIRITIGKGLKDNLVEVKLRSSDDSYNVNTEEIIDHIKSLIA